MKRYIGKHLGEDFVLKHCFFISRKENSDIAEKSVGNDVWYKYQLLSISPKISSGVSYDQRYFHKAYVLTAPVSGSMDTPIISVRMIKQMLGRVRTLIDNEVVHCLPSKPSYNNFPTGYDAINQFY